MVGTRMLHMQAGRLYFRECRQVQMHECRRIVGTRMLQMQVLYLIVENVEVLLRKKAREMELPAAEKESLRNGAPRC